MSGGTALWVATGIFADRFSGVRKSCDGVIFWGHIFELKLVYSYAGVAGRHKDA